GNAFGLVEDIMADGAAIARSATGGPAGPARRRDASPAGSERQGGGAGRTIAWQEAVLALNAICERCNEVLRKGTRAAVGIVEGDGPRPIRCLGCIDESAVRREREEGEEAGHAAS